MRTLVGGVGYRYLRDFSVGPLLSDALAEESWPPHVVAEELSYGPVAVSQRLQEADPPFGRLVLAGAVRRGRESGTVTAYRWDGTLPPDDEIQERVAEAVTGVVDLDNLVVVCAALGPLPEQVLVVEVEPEVEAMGEEMTPAVRSGFQEALRHVRAFALGEGAPPPVAPLGGPAVPGAAGAAPSEDVRQPGGARDGERLASPEAPVTEGGMTDLETVVERLDRVLVEVEEHPDARVREWVVEALGALERLHSEGLRRMAALVERSPGGLRPALEDPVVANLLFLHGVTGNEGPGRSVVAVEGGAPGADGQDRVRLDSGETVSFLPESSLRRLERRLRDAEGEEPDEPVPGRENGTPARTGSASRWVEVGPAAEIEGPGLHGYMAAGQPVLLLEARGGIRAYRNACPDSILPLHLGRRRDEEVVCPWHGCRFDAATGERRGGEGPGLRPLSLRTDGGVVRVEVP